MSGVISSIGSEVEFGREEENKLKEFFMVFNTGKMYNDLLTRKRNSDRMYIENRYIFEYRSPVISADSYFRFAKYYFFVSYFSNFSHPEGYYDEAAGSIHTHLKFIEDKGTTYLNNIYILMPFMSRVVNYKEAIFRTSVRFDGDNDYYALVEYMDTIETDSKTYWITYNTGSQCVEVRLNENIPVWYLLLDYIPNNENLYEIHEENYINDNYYIPSFMKQARDKKEFKNEIQKEYYFILLDYLEFYWNEILKKERDVSIKDFSKYLLNVKPKVFNGLLERYEDIREQMSNLTWTGEEDY